MVNPPLPNELRQFLARYIRSIEQLEILCRLAENPDQWWASTEMYKQIQSSHRSVEANLQHFLKNGFAIQNPLQEYRFSPETPEKVRIASELVTAYRQRPVALIETLYTMPSDAIRQFSDAFKLGDKKP